MEGFSQPQEDSKSELITTYRIAQQHSMVSFKFNSQVEQVVPLPDYEGLVIFENGMICKVNFLHEQILNTGLIDKDIKKVVLYDKTTIAFVSYSEKRVGFFDFVKFKLTKPLIINLPTELGMPISERTENALEDIFRDGIQLIVLPESKFIVILEIKNSYQHQTENVITAFHESSPTEIFSQVKYNEPRQKMFLMEPLNKIDTICVYSQIIDKDPVELLVWNISKKGEGLIPQFKLTDIIEGAVQTVFQFGENTAGALINMSDQQKSFPILKVFDFTQGSPAKEITTILDVAPQNGMNGINSINSDQPGAFMNDQRSFCLQDVFLTDVAAQKIIWFRQSFNGQFFDVYNPKSNKIVFEDFIRSNYSRDDEDNNDMTTEQIVPSVDKKYFVLYSPQLSDASDSNRQDITFMICSIVEVKSSIMHLLLQKDIPKIYGEEVCKNIVDMLTKSDSESE